MSHTLQQLQVPPSSSSSPQLTSSTPTSSAATLASLLTSALADVERLKQEVDALTKRAVCAENLLRSLAVEDASPTTTASATTASSTTSVSAPSGTAAASSNNSNNISIDSSKNGLTSQSLTPAALTALMSAESRATAAETRLATFLDSWTELIRLEDRATDERRRLDDRVLDERRRVVMSFERDSSSTVGVGPVTSSSGAFGRPSPPTYPLPLLRAESAPLTYSSSSSFTSSARQPPLRPTSSFAHHTSSYSHPQHVPYSFQVNGVSAPGIVPPSHTRIRPRTTSDAAASSQPPSKRFRASSASSSQVQQHPNSYYPQPAAHPSPSTRVSPHSHTQQIPPQNTNTSRSHHMLHPSQHTYPNQPSKTRISPTATIISSNTNTSNSRSRPQDHASQQTQLQQHDQQQKGHTNRYFEPADREDESGDTTAMELVGPVDENGRSSDVPRAAKVKITSAKRSITSSSLRYRGDGHSHLHHSSGARDREVSDLDNELGGIIDDAMLRVPPNHPLHHQHHHHSVHNQTEHDDEMEQEDHSTVLVDELLDDSPYRHRSNVNRPPDFEVLAQDEEVDAEGEEDELSNASIDDLLLEVAGDAGAGAQPLAPGANVGTGGFRERSDPGSATLVTGEKGIIKTRSSANVKGFVSVARLAQTQSQSQLLSPSSQSQTIRPKQQQPLRQHLSTSSALAGNTDTSAGGGSGGPDSRSPVPSALPQSGGTQVTPAGGLTSTNSLTGLTPSLSAQHLFKAAGLPPGGYPPFNPQGERLCRQCGQAGRYKDGKCVEKWGPGPEGPGTVCDRCRKKMKRVERRGDANATMLAQAQAQARAEAQHNQAQAQAHAAQNGTLSAQNSLVSATGRGEKNAVKSSASSRSPHVSPRSEREKEREKEKVKEEGLSVIPAVIGGGGGGGGNGSPTDASTDASADELKSVV